jgi:cell division protein FtsQ
MKKQQHIKRTFYHRKSAPPKKIRKAKNRLLGTLLFIVLVWFTLGFIRSDFFRIEAIHIVGNTHTAEDEIRLALPVSEGSNIWQLNPGKLADKLTEIPRVEHATVTRKLPRTLLVEITEKRALALVPYQDYLFEVGPDGMVLGITQDPQDYELPLLTGLVPMELSVGEQYLTGPQLEDAREVLQALEDQGVLVSELNLTDQENLVMVTLDGLIVWLGRDSYTEKVELLQQIMGQLSGRQAEGYMDLRVLSAPAFHILQEEKTQKNN